MAPEALALTIVMKDMGRLNAVFFLLKDPDRNKVSDHPDMYTFSEEGSQGFIGRSPLLRDRKLPGSGSGIVWT